jgi:N-acyl-D-aspartate/D-glutamate deacylase
VVGGLVGPVDEVLDDAARGVVRGSAGQVDALRDGLVEERDGPTIVVTMMDQPDVQRILRILKHPPVMLGSDAIITRGHPHARTRGTRPWVPGHYGRDVGLFSPAEAVRKMTSLPARVRR